MLLFGRQYVAWTALAQAQGDASGLVARNGAPVRYPLCRSVCQTLRATPATEAGIANTAGAIVGVALWILCRGALLAIAFYVVRFVWTSYDPLSCSQIRERTLTILRSPKTPEP